MASTASLFTQILSLFQRSDFARHVKELKAERHARGFSCWEQFVAMLFCQLAQARSLRRFLTVSNPAKADSSTWDWEAEPKRSALSYANAHRPWELYQKLFYDLLYQCEAI